VTDKSADATRARNRRAFDGAFGRMYSFEMDRPLLARLVGRVLWGGDVRPFYEGIEEVSRLPDGVVVADAPCGSGIAFSQLSPGQRLRYLALDLSPVMLARARARAMELALDQVEFIEGDAEQIPLEDGSVDMFMSWWGLHCLPDPERGVHEIARCLKPGGRAIGAMICSGRSLRQRLLVKPRRGAFGPTGTSHDLARWLDEAGLPNPRIDVSGTFAYFEATA
jgi:SAM-dependent methyltransferase